MNSGFKTKLAALAALLTIGSSASAAIVTTNFVTTNAALIDIFSTTLDNGNSTVLPNSACAALAGAALQECQFFSGVAPAPSPLTRKIAITQNGFGAGLSQGVLNVDWDNVTGEIVTVNSLTLNYQDMTINIAAFPPFGFTSAAIAIVTNGNSAPVAGDQAFSSSSNDPDTGLAIGQANVFQGGLDGGAVNNPDFATFTDIVDSCTPVPAGPSACFLLGVLTLDADKYRIDGTLSASGGSFTLRAQTGNNSIYTSTFDATAVVPVPAAVWLFGSALGLMGFVRRRAVTG
jgi:hypothetical protein